MRVYERERVRVRVRVRGRVHMRVYERERVREKVQARSLNEKWIEGKDMKQGQIKMRRHARTCTSACTGACTCACARREKHAVYQKSGLKGETRGKDKSR